jgi:hypothetical protein
MFLQRVLGWSNALKASVNPWRRSSQEQRQGAGVNVTRATAGDEPDKLTEGETP